MSTRVTLADQALMEKLASLEPDPEEAEPGEQTKVASVEDYHGRSARMMLKAGEVMRQARRLGRARAEAELAELFGS